MRLTFDIRMWGGLGVCRCGLLTVCWCFVVGCFVFIDVFGVGVWRCVALCLFADVCRVSILVVFVLLFACEFVVLWYACLGVGLVA